MSSQEVVNADCLTYMKTLPDKSFDLVLTDPPYNISQKSGGLRELDFGEWDKDGDHDIVFNAIKEIERVGGGYSDYLLRKSTV